MWNMGGLDMIKRYGFNEKKVMEINENLDENINLTVWTIEL